MGTALYFQKLLLLFLKMEILLQIITDIDWITRFKSIDEFFWKIPTLKFYFLKRATFPPKEEEEEAIILHTQKILSWPIIAITNTNFKFQNSWFRIILIMYNRSKKKGGGENFNINYRRETKLVYQSSWIIVYFHLMPLNFH